MTTTSIAFGSGSELESQLEIAKALFPNHNYERSQAIPLEAMRILNKFLT